MAAQMQGEVWPSLLGSPRGTAFRPQMRCLGKSISTKPFFLGGAECWFLSATSLRVV